MASHNTYHNSMDTSVIDIEESLQAMGCAYVYVRLCWEKIFLPHSYWSHTMDYVYLAPLRCIEEGNKDSQKCRCQLIFVVEPKVSRLTSPEVGTNRWLLISYVGQFLRGKKHKYFDLLITPEDSLSQCRLCAPHISKAMNKLATNWPVIARVSNVMNILWIEECEPKQSW